MIKGSINIYIFNSTNNTEFLLNLVKNNLIGHDVQAPMSIKSNHCRTASNCVLKILYSIGTIPLRKVHLIKDPHQNS